MERKTKKEQALGLRREMQPDHHHLIANDGGITPWMPSVSTLRSPLITSLVKSMRSQRTGSHRAAFWSPEQLADAGEGLWKGKGKCPLRNHSALCPEMAVMKGHRFREAWNAGPLLGGHRSRRVAGSTYSFTWARNDLVLSQWDFLVVFTWLWSSTLQERSLIPLVCVQR